MPARIRPHVVEPAATRVVLVLEPDADVRELLRLRLLQLGYEPLTAVVPDMPEPGVILVEPACELLRAEATRVRREWPQAAIVCLSIYAPEYELEPEGTVAYLIKPALDGSLGRALAQAYGSGEKR